MDNSWQGSMYDKLFAQKTLNSIDIKQRAAREVDFLLNTLKLPKGASVLDVPCGSGRHAKVLAEKGFKVTGIDISEACIDLAKADGVAGVDFRIGDMAKLDAYKSCFDCTLNLFSSFGYFSTDEENEQVLKQLIDTLSTGGKLVLNLINRKYLLSVYRPVFWHKSGSTILVNAGKYDEATSYNESYITVKDEDSGETTMSYHRMRLYTPEEIVDLMKRHGLKDIRTYGDYKGSAMDDMKSSHPFYIGTK